MSCKADELWFNSRQTLRFLSPPHLPERLLGHPNYSERSHHDVLKIQLTLHRYTSAQSIFILKQGYMFRLEVSHLQTPTTFSLPDALPTLASGNENVVGA